MPIERIYYDLHFEADEAHSEPRTERVPLTHGDRLRAELEGKMRNVALGDSLNMTSIILWCAATRERVFDGGYDVFVQQLIDYDPVTAKLHGLPESVDPTQRAAATASPSPSLPAGLPSTGLTPTSTSS